jgi:antitoxin Phd
MLVDTKAMVSLTEANQNFSRVARTVDEQGTVLILKNNVPRYVIMDISRFEAMESVQQEKIEAIAARIIKENLPAFQELAK